MKTKNLITAFLLIFTVVFFACDNKPEEPCEEPEMNYPIEFSLAGTSCFWKYHHSGATGDSNDTLFVINSNEELQNRIRCFDENYPEIDFSRHTLLLALGDRYVPVGNYKLVVDLTQHSEHEYELTITIYWRQTIIDGGELWTSAILVPKISDKANVVLNIEYIEIFE